MAGLSNAQLPLRFWEANTTVKIHLQENKVGAIPAGNCCGFIKCALTWLVRFDVFVSGTMKARQVTQGDFITGESHYLLLVSASGILARTAVSSISLLPPLRLAPLWGFLLRGLGPQLLRSLRDFGLAGEGNGDYCPSFKSPIHDVDASIIRSAPAKASFSSCVNRSLSLPTIASYYPNDNL